MPDHPHVQLGSHSLPVYGQTWARVVNRLGRLYDSVRATGGELDTDNLDAGALVGFLGGRAYEALCIFIPNLPERMPEYEFAGYGSREAFDAGDYDENLDKAPTFPELIAAFETCFEVNGGKRFVSMLGGVFDPKLLRAEMSLALSEWREQRSGSLNSLSTSDGSTDQSNSGTTDRISDALDTQPALANGSQTESSSGNRQPIAA